MTIPENTNSGHDSAQAGRVWSLVIFLATTLIGLLWLMIPNFDFFSDGVQFAVELKYGSEWVLHPNHVLYPLLPQIVNVFARPGQGEMDFLVGWSWVMGVSSLAAMVFLIKTITGNNRTILVALTLFAFTNGVWYFSVTPNQNSTALLLNIVTLLLITLTASRKSATMPMIVGIASMVAISTLGSQVNAALIFPAVWAVYAGSKSREEKIFNIGLLVLLTLGIFLSLFTLIGVYFGRFTTPADFVEWQRSYVFQSRWWVGDIGDLVARNIKGNLNLLLGNMVGDGGLNTGAGDEAGPIDCVMLPIQFIVLIFLAVEFGVALKSWRDEQSKPILQTIGLLVGVPIFLFSIFYIPENLNLRILYVPGFMLFLLPSIEKRFLRNGLPLKRTLPVFIVIVLLFTANLVGKYLPESRQDSNPWLSETITLIEKVDPDDLIIYPWTDYHHTQALYAQYYIGCDAITINKLLEIEKYVEPDEFHDFLFAPEDSRTIYIHADLVDDADSSEWLTQKYGGGPTPDEIMEFMERWFGEDYESRLIPALGKYHTLNDH